MKIALIDVGSLKVKCEIREYIGTSVSSVLYRDQVRTALVRGLEENNDCITQEALQMTVDVLLFFQQKIEELHVDSIYVVGTEAIRKAKNSDDVLRFITERTNLTLEIISQSKEGSYFFHAVEGDFYGQRIATVDIGGASTQVIIGKDGVIEEQYLFSTGTYTLRTRFIHNERPTTISLKQSEDYIRNQLATLSQSLLRPEYIVYGSTNVIDFIEALDVLRMPLLKSDNNQHAIVVERAALETLLHRIGPLAYIEREALYPSDPYYMHGADMSLMNVLAVCHFLHVEKVIPSNENVSAGIFRAMVENRQPPHIL